MIFEDHNSPHICPEAMETKFLSPFEKWGLRGICGGSITAYLRHCRQRHQATTALLPRCALPPSLPFAKGGVRFARRPHPNLSIYAR